MPYAKTYYTEFSALLLPGALEDKLSLVPPERQARIETAKRPETKASLLAAGLLLNTVMKQEYGIDMEKDQYSKLLEDIPEADIYVSMGCNVACPNIPGKQMLNWGLDDPTGQEDAVFMDVIRRIEENVLEMRDGEGR